MLYQNNGKSIDEIAALFHKAPRTIYRWIKTKQAPNAEGDPETKPHRNRPRKYPASIFSRIVELKQELPRRPATTIQLLLKQESPQCCPSVSLIRKYLADLGLTKKDPNYKRGYVKFVRDYPNDLWQIDIAGVQTVGTLGKLYLHALLDDCSRFIVAARYFRDQKGINILWILREAFEEYGRPHQILTDNGTQFRNTIGELGTRYTRLLQLLDVQPIFARPHHPQTKGKLERWFGTVKQSFLNEGRYYLEQHPETSLAKFNELFQEWLSWYNRKKPHRSLPNSCPPAEVFFNHPNRLERPLPALVDWNRWLVIKECRKVSKYNTISYKTHILTVPEGYMGCQVDILEASDQIEIYYHDACLNRYHLPQDLIGIVKRTDERRVGRTGKISYHGRYFLLGSAHAGKRALIKETQTGTKIAVYIENLLVKEFPITRGKPNCKKKSS